MTTSFEDQLRADLRAAADGGATTGIDPAAVIAAGTRVVRRRRLAYAGSAAVVAILAVVGGLALTPGTRRTPAPPVPATQSATARATATARLELTSVGGSNGGTAFAGGTYEVQLDRDPSTEADLTYWQVESPGGTSEKVVALGRSATPKGGVGVTWGHAPGSPVIIGVAPKGAKLLGVVNGFPEGGGSTGDTAPLAGTDYEAFAYAFSAAKDADAVTAVVYEDASGAVVSSTGERAQTAAFPNGERAYVLPGLAVWGVAGEAMGPLSPTPDGGWVSSSRSGSGTDTHWSLVGLLPGRAADVTATAGAGGHLQGAPSVVGLGSYSAYQLSVVGKDPVKAVAALTWRDPAGASHTWTPRAR